MMTRHDVLYIMTRMIHGERRMKIEGCRRAMGAMMNVDVDGDKVLGSDWDDESRCLFILKELLHWD